MESLPVSPWSCFACRRRKVRCDRHHPCSHCSKHSLDCGFPVSGRTPTRRTDGSNNQDRLIGRLRRLEHLVDKLGGGTALAGSPDRREAPEWGTMVAHGNDTLYIGKPLWGLLSEEVKHLRQSVETDNSLPDSLEEQLLTSPTRSSPFFWGRPLDLEENLHPLPSQVPFIWDVFVDNIDPFMKVLHVPSVARAIRETKGVFKAMEPGMEALMFAVTLAAVSSLGDEEVTESFGEDKRHFLSRLFLGTEQALSRAGVLTTTDTRVVQALIIYLEVLERRDGPRGVWTLAGLLLRIAMRIGLHRDGSNFDSITPFDAELRRRIWWHIVFLDSRVAGCQVFDVGIGEDVFDTKEPDNLDDEDLMPAAKQQQLPPSREGKCTAMTLCIIRTRLWRLEHRFRSSVVHSHTTSEALEARRRLLADSKKEASAYSQRHLRPKDDPFHMVLHTLITTQLTTMDLIFSTNPEVGGPLISPASSRTAFLLATASLHHIFQLIDRETSTCSWALHGCLNWQTISPVLTRLASPPSSTDGWGPVSETAWRLAGRAFEHLSGAMAGDPMRTSLFGLVALAEQRRNGEREKRRWWWSLQGVEEAEEEEVVMPEIGDFSGSRDEREMAFDVSGLEARLALEARVHGDGVGFGDSTLTCRDLHINAEPEASPVGGGGGAMDSAWIDLGTALTGGGGGLCTNDDSGDDAWLAWDGGPLRRSQQWSGT